METSWYTKGMTPKLVVRSPPTHGTGAGHVPARSAASGDPVRAKSASAPGPSRFIVAQRADWLRGDRNAQAVEIVAPGDVLEVKGMDGEWAAVRLYYASKNLLRAQDHHAPAPSCVHGRSVLGWVHTSTVRANHHLLVIHLAKRSPPCRVVAHEALTYGQFVGRIPQRFQMPGYAVQYLALDVLDREPHGLSPVPSSPLPLDAIGFRGGDSDGEENRDLGQDPHQAAYRSALIGLVVPRAISGRGWNGKEATFQRLWRAWAKRGLCMMPSWDAPRAPPPPGARAPAVPSRRAILAHYHVPLARWPYNAGGDVRKGGSSWSRPGYRCVIGCLSNGIAEGGISYVTSALAASLVSGSKNLTGVPSAYQIAGSEFSAGGAGTKHWWPPWLEFIWSELNVFLAFLEPTPMAHGGQTGASQVHERVLALQRHVRRTVNAPWPATLADSNRGVARCSPGAHPPHPRPRRRRWAVSPRLQWTRMVTAWLHSVAVRVSVTLTRNPHTVSDGRPVIDVCATPVDAALSQSFPLRVYCHP